MKLVLPAKTHARSSRNVARADEPARGRTEKRTFRWYQIKKNDRYVSIAREQLGNGNRWKELYELNRDKFPDPQRIREGVRIRIPTDDILSMSGARR